jgi:hypothetical protein
MFRCSASEELLALDTADHLLRARGDRIYVADVIATSASRYLPAGEQAATLLEGTSRSARGDGGVSCDVSGLDAMRWWRVSLLQSATTMLGQVPMITFLPPSVLAHL